VSRFFRLLGLRLICLRNPRPQDLPLANIVCFWHITNLLLGFKFDLCLWSSVHTYIHLLPTWRYSSTVFAMATCLSVHLSVTHRYCV